MNYNAGYSWRTINNHSENPIHQVKQYHMVRKESYCILCIYIHVYSLKMK